MGWDAITEKTIKTLPELLRQLKEIRQCGISFDRGETLEGISTMGVALDTLLGRFAVSLLVPAARFHKNEALYRDEILRCKEAMMRKIGKHAGA